MGARLKPRSDTQKIIFDQLKLKRGTRVNEAYKKKFQNGNEAQGLFGNTFLISDKA